MTIDELPEVVIDAFGGRKFIIAQLGDAADNKRLVVRANQECNYHDDILKLLRQEVRPYGLNAHCIGGGRIEINPETTTIRIWGKSVIFGLEPDRKETVRMLQAAFPDFRIDVGNSW